MPNQPHDTGDRRGGRARPIGRLVARVAAPALKKRGLTRAELLVDWAQVVGPYFAAHTAPLKLSFPRGRSDAGVLQLAVAPGLAVAIQHEAPRLIERINGWFGHAAIGRLTLTTAGPPVRAARRRMPAPPAAAAMPAAVAAMDESPLKLALARLNRHFAGRTAAGD
ncbi:MAG: DciA family protein [Alphaproteobacteria bacterium]